MNILITGGSGMVGHNLIEAISDGDANVLAPTHDEVDLLDTEQIDDYMSYNGIDFVVHCAGFVGGIHINMANKDIFMSDNIIMGLNLINASRKNGVKRLINLGSSCMYPMGADVPFKEESLFTGLCEPTNEGYAIAKNAVAKMCEFVSAKGFEYKTLIPCNLYGRWDNFDPRSSHLIASIIDKLHKAKTSGQKQVEIWGDGKSRREFMYAGDLADFICQAIRRFEHIPQYLNVGNGEEITINEYYRAVADVVGYDSKMCLPENTEISSEMIPMAGRIMM